MTPEHLMYDKAHDNMCCNRQAVLDAVTNLIMRAQEVGMVVRVEAVPGSGHPAMDNIDMKAQVYPHMTVLRQLDELLQDAMVADDQARMNCLEGVHSWAMEVGKLTPDTMCLHCGALYGHPD